MVVSDINEDLLMPLLIYSQPYQYGNIILYPVKMEYIIDFSMYKESIIVRKDSTFHDKQIIKMTYLDFLKHCIKHPEVGQKYNIPMLQHYYQFAIFLLQMVCKEQEFKLIGDDLYINNEKITPEIFDDLRRIIIIQNDIDFNIDEFIHYDTEQALKKAKDRNTNDNVTIEDYIDALCVALKYTEEQVMNLSIRKFWRLVKRYRLFEDYTICKTGEMSGMVTFKEPIKYWITSVNEDDQYKDVKADENALRSKIG